MFKTKKRFRKTYRKKNTKSYHSKNKKTYNKLKHKKTHKKKVQRGGLKCNTRPNLPVYIVLGHGQTTLTLTDIPEECVYVSFSELFCSTYSNNTAISNVVNNLFDSTSQYHSILKDPCKYWPELKENFSNSENKSGINIHYPHETQLINQYVDVIYILFGYHPIKQAETANICISGVYQITSNVKRQSLQDHMEVKKNDIINPAVMKFAYRYSIYPTYDQVILIISDDKGQIIMTYNDLYEHMLSHATTQSELFQMYPGIFYNILCKSVPIADKSKKSVIKKGIELRRRSIRASNRISTENIMLAYVSLPYAEMIKRKNDWRGALQGQTQYGCEINVLLFLNLITPDRAAEIMNMLDHATTIIARHITLSEIINKIFIRSDLFEITYDTTQDVGDTTGYTAIKKIAKLYNYILNELPNDSCILIKLNRLHYLGHTIILMKYSDNLFSYDPQFNVTSKNVVRLQTSTPKIFTEYYLKNGFVSATIIYCRDRSSQLINELVPMQVIEDISSGGGGPVLSGTLNCDDASECTNTNLVVTIDDQTGETGGVTGETGSTGETGATGATGESSGGGTGKPCYTPTCIDSGDDDDYIDSGDEDNTSSSSTSNNKNTKILTNIYKAMGIPYNNVSGYIQDSEIQEIKDNEREFLKYTIMHNINNMLENYDIPNIVYLITALDVEGLAGLDVPKNYNEVGIDNLKKYFETKNIDEIYDNISLELFKKLFQ